VFHHLKEESENEKKFIAIGISLVLFIGIAGQVSARPIACWDLNQNGKCDLETEDLNHDGRCTKSDCDVAVEPCYVPQTGITTSYGVGDDGALHKGVPWPNPRFTDNDDGTVTDNLTKLIWLKDAGCAVAKNWADALTFCNTLASGNCGLSDGSQAGDWRLPNLRELHSLLHYGFTPTLPNTAGTGPWTEGDPFTNVPDYWYWSSTTYMHSPPDYAWHVTMHTGDVTAADKLNALPVWPVRGGK
jgi:hypothetical protein